MRLLGARSGAEKNDDNEPDDVFIKPALRAGPRGSTGSGASAGERAPTDSTTRAGGAGGGPTPLSSHVNATQWIEKLKQSLRGNEVNSRGISTVFGNVDVEMTPGTYDLDIGGHKFSGVVVEQRSDTRVNVGVLRLNAGPNTRFEIFEVGGKKGLQTLFGHNDTGLPVGNYEVEVNGQREIVTIQPGKVTEY